MNRMRALLVSVGVFSSAAAGCGGDDAERPDSGTPLSQASAASNPGAPLATLELEGAYPEGFSYLNGVRELSDGRVLAADPLTQLLLRIDLDAGTADTLGGVGPGPQEYKQPDQVFPLPGDSTLLVDLEKMRLTVIDPSGELGDGIPMTLPGEGWDVAVLHPQHVDRQGRLYDLAPRGRGRGSQDSLAVIRYERATATFDTVGMVWLPKPEQIPVGNGFQQRMLEPSDDWGVGPDGRVALVRAKDFSVEWRLPDGRVVIGPPTPYPTFPVERADKEAYLAEIRTTGISSTAVGHPSTGIQRLTMSRGLYHSGDVPDVSAYAWAESLPRFRSGRTRVSPRGEAWVQPFLPAGSPPRVELFDAAGAHLGFIPLPRGGQVIGFGEERGGEETVYVARTDEFDLKWLERYRVVR